ncbi:MAG TPA: Crp/Fnr family transcriptional regulator [Ramlibacter sp.]|nr:Crp/Fnr family transcriptional regulator [Ramlibacter sp.]
MPQDQEGEARASIAPGLVSWPHSAGRNVLLDGLLPDESTRLCARMDRVRLNRGERLAGLGRSPSHAYFLLSGLAVLDYEIGNGQCTSVSVVGREGVVGLSLFMSGETSPIGASVIAPGEAFRLRADVLVAERRVVAGIPVCVLRYMQALTTQMAQTAVCNRHHLLPQQLSRWLLLAFDRIDDGDLRITHEVLAQLLGVRREGVTVAIGALVEAGCLRTSRAHVAMGDRARLEAASCDCYRIIRDEYARLLGTYRRS